MSVYKKTVWKNGDVITADGMNQMESGITTAADAATAAQTTADANAAKNVEQDTAISEAATAAAGAKEVADAAKTTAEANAAKIAAGDQKDVEQDSAISEAATAAAGAKEAADAAQLAAEAARAIADANAKSIATGNEKDELQDASISANAAKNTAQDAAISEAKSVADEAKAATESNAAKIAAGDQKDEEQDSAIVEAKNAAAGAQAATETNAAKITNLEAQATAHDESFKSVEASLTNHAETITKQGEAINECVAQCNTLSETVTSMSSSISTLNSNMQTLSDNDGTLAAADTQLQKNIDAVNTSVAAHDVSIASLTTAVTAAQSTADEAKTAAATAQSTADAAKADAASAYETAKSAGELATAAKEVADNSAARNVEQDAAFVTIDSHLTQHDDLFVTQDAQSLVTLQKLALLEQQLAALKVKTAVSNDLSSGSTVTSEDELLVVPAAAITEVTAITGKAVTMTSATVESSKVSVTATGGDVTVSGLTMTGNLPKATSNAAVSLNTDGGIVKISNGDLDQLGYNAIEVGLNKTPSSVLIENIDFKATLSNNAISVFGLQKGGVLTISNCHIAHCSNPIRISNRLNTSFTINLVNCTVDAWETTSPWQGFMIFQDYTSTGTAEEIAAANQFSPEKIKVNIVNCTGPKGKLTAPEDPATVYGSGTEDQVIYVYNNTENLIAYSEERYPEIVYR